MINIATVGTSTITEKFISACKYTGRYNLSTAYSRSADKAEEFTKKHGFEKSCCNLEEMSKDSNIDAVYIASPNSLHFEQSRLFLNNGKHVICEKPIVTSSKEYSALSGLAAQNGLIYMEAIMSHHNPSRQILLDSVKKAGKISQARINYCQRSSRYDSFINGEHVNIFDMSLAAGTLMDLGVYCVYAAVDLFGIPKNINSFSSYFKNGADSAGVSVFNYEDFSAVLTYSKMGESAVASEIVGDNGTVKIGSVSQYIDISFVKGKNEEQLYGMPDRTEVMSHECAKFADYIEYFNEFADDYAKTDVLTENVHKCMDEIKKSAGINYNVKE